MRDDVAEVPGVGAERDGRAVGGRLDHVLAAALVRLPPTKAMCAVPHQAPSSPTASTSRTRGSGIGGAVASSCGAALPAHAAAVQQLGDFVEPFGMPRHEDQLAAAGCVGDELLERRPAPAILPGPACCRRGRRRRFGDAGQLRPGGCVSGLSRSVRAPSNLIEPVTCTALGRAPSCAEPLGIFVVLHGDQIDLLEDRGRRARRSAGSRESSSRSGGR